MHQSMQVDESARHEHSGKSLKCLGVATPLWDLHQCLEHPVSWQHVNHLDKCHNGCQKVSH